MKAFLVLLAVTLGAATTSPQVCEVPAKYALASAAACTGPAPGYIVTGFCQSPFHPNLPDITLVPTVSAQLTTATANAWTVLGAAVTTHGCQAAADGQYWGNTMGAGFAANLIADAIQCGARTAPAIAATGAMPTAPTASTFKGVSVVCDNANRYFASAGVEGPAWCYGGTAAGANFWANAMLNAPTGIFSATYGLLADATRTASWMTSVLTCSLACTVDAAFCANNTYHANVIAAGTGLVAGTCFMRPSTTATFICRNDPYTTYTATCTANGVNTVAGTVTFAPSTPSCGGSDGALTGFYINNQVDGTTTQSAGAIDGFSTAASTLTKGATATVGQWGGYPRQTVAFQTASAYTVAITGCPTDTTRGECVQQVVNWWRCRGLTIDSGTVCFAGAARIACPTHTNGFRCPRSSKKGLLGLLGLLGLIPLLLCLLLVCCLLLCLCRRKKTEGDVHFATFDPHAAPVAGSYHPGTIFAPSMGAPVVY